MSLTTKQVNEILEDLQNHLQACRNSMVKKRDIIDFCNSNLSNGRLSAPGITTND